MTKVYNLSVEKVIVRGVAFSPVLRQGCWVDEGETTDPAALSYFARYPESYPIVADEIPLSGRETKLKLDPLLNPSQVGVISAAARSEKQEIVVQGNAQEPMHVEDVQEPVVTVPDPQSVAVTGWPESLDKEIVALLVAAEWSPEDVRACKSDAQLEALKGIGKASVKKFRAAFE